MTNAAIADNFSLLSKLMDIHGENSFKARSYSTAAYTIERLPEELSLLPTDKIPHIKGIGDSIAKAIIEQLTTGTWNLLTTYLSKTPAGVIEMLQIKGLGPKKIATIWNELGIDSIGELLYACNENRLTLFKGFGEKTQQNVKAAIEYYLSQQGNYLYAQVEQFAAQMQQVLPKIFPQHQFLPTGDFYMQRVTISKLCWVTTATASVLEQFFTQHQYHIQPTDSNDSIAFLGPENILLEFYLTVNATPAELQFKYSCSHTFWEAFTQVLHLPQGKFHSDNAIFEAAQLTYVPPFAREQASAIQPISKATTPVIVVNDIKGIIHSHSKWSDGTHSLAEMATAAKQQGFEYLVISDHSRTASYAGGLSIERLLAQQQEIDALNQQLAPFTIFKSIESDILTDGSLDYPTEILATLDLVIASVHSGLSMNEEKAMQRLIKAIENPYTNILGHLTGRLLLSRAGYPIDHETIIDACAANGVVIELNAHPRRLDIDWKYLEYAMKKEVLISINPDAHAIDGFSDVKYGVLVAQKALLPASQNLSSFSLPQMQHFIQQQHTKRNS